MHKVITRVIYVIAVFAAAVLVMEHFSNRTNQATTVNMADATLPVVTMREGDYSYNELHGYTTEQSQEAYFTPLTKADENRQVLLQINMYGDKLTSCTYELRSMDGVRLIEDGNVTITQEQDGMIDGSIRFSTLMEKGRQYLLVVVTDTPNNPSVHFYTRVIFNESTDENESYEKAIAFAQTFHKGTIDGSQKQLITSCIEPDTSRASSSFARVTIHDTYEKITFSDLNPEEVTAPVYTITDQRNNYFTLTGSYILRAMNEDAVSHLYRCTEHYYFCEGSDRTQLLDYSRTMEQIFDAGSLDSDTSYRNNAILLGVTDTDNAQILSSDGGEALAFVQEGRLYSVQKTDNTVSYVFGFGEPDSVDVRENYRDYDIRILHVDATGSIDFLVTGYMNRGTHEGEVGISVNHYNSVYKTVEEEVFLTWSHGSALLRERCASAAYLSADNILYVMPGDDLYQVDLNRKSCEVYKEGVGQNNSYVSQGGRMIAWKSGADGRSVDSGENSAENSSTTGTANTTENSTAGTANTTENSTADTANAADNNSLADASNDAENGITLLDLSDGTSVYIRPEGAGLQPLGFMGEDLIVGILSGTGSSRHPMMSELRIYDADGSILEDYTDEGSLITGIEISDNQITIHRAANSGGGSGKYTALDDDQIISEEKKSETLPLQTRQDDRLGTVCEISAYGIDPGSVRYVQPKEVLSEDSHTTALDTESVQETESTQNADASETSDVYFAFNMTGYAGSANTLTDAIRLSGGREASDPVVVNEQGGLVWRPAIDAYARINGLRAVSSDTAENSETESETGTSGSTSSLMRCIAAAAVFEGGEDLTQSVASASGISAMELLEESVDGLLALDLSGVEMQDTWYYIDNGHPVIAMTGDEEAVLILGYDQKAVTILDPVQKATTSVSLEKAEEMFSSAGNRFIAYVLTK